MLDRLVPDALKGLTPQSSSRLQDWLISALPEFGIIQLDESKDRLTSILTDIQLYNWIPSIFPTFAEFLCDRLQLSTSDPALITHSLRRWAESGNTLWICVDASDCTDDQLLELLAFRPVNHSGQFALRIMLIMSDQRCKQAALRPLVAVIPERLIRHTDAKKAPLSRQASLALGVTVAAIGIYLGVRATSVFLPDYWHNIQIESVSEKKTLNSVVDVPADATPPELIPTEVTAVKEMVFEWLKAWNNQSVSSYLSFYHEDYSGRKDMSSDEWRRWRVKRLMDPLWIRIEVGPITVESLGGKARVSFWQIYRSPSYQDETFKELLLERSDKRWVIVDETSREVRPL